MNYLWILIYQSLYVVFFSNIVNLNLMNNWTINDIILIHFLLQFIWKQKNKEYFKIQTYIRSKYIRRTWKIIFYFTKITTKKFCEKIY